MEIFSANLKKRAAQLGLSNAEVARRAGLSERRYGNYISGRREPDLATLVRIAGTLRTTPNELLSFDKARSKPENLAHERIQSASQSLGRADQEILALIADALVSKKRKNIA